MEVRMVARIAVAAGAGAALIGVVAAGPAGAFWERSQAIRCADAATPSEWRRLRCWELGAHADPGWPRLGAIGIGIEDGPPAAALPSRRGAVSKW
jgi:hypothetical protein